jgi:enoyl reductase-like protein
MPESEEAMDENCERIKKLLELYREDKLTDDEKADVEYHLLVCPECIFLLTLVPAYSPD